MHFFELTEEKSNSTYSSIKQPEIPFIYGFLTFYHFLMCLQLTVNLNGVFTFGLMMTAKLTPDLTYMTEHIAVQIC